MKTCIIAIFCFSTIFSYGQDDRFIRSLKFTPFVFGEAMYAPISIDGKKTELIQRGNTSKDSTIYRFGRPISFSFLSVIYTLRLNIYEFSVDDAIGINASPNFGLSVSDYGFLSVNLPIYLTYNRGVGSIKNTEEDAGVYFGFGYEFTRINLITTDRFSIGLKSTYEEIEPQNFWSQPIFIIGYRWLSKKDKLWEVSFKYGWSSDSKDIPRDVKNEIGGKPQTFQIGFGWIYR